MAKRILITGAAGLIGAELLKQLYTEEDSFLLVDDFSTGNRKRINWALEQENVKLVPMILGGRAGSESVQRTLTEIRPDIVYHLAAPVGVQTVLSRPQIVVTSQLAAMLQLLSSISKNVPFVYTSTSEVYGRNPKSPLSEDTESHIGSPTNPRWSYAIGKLAAEAVLAHSNQQRYLILRLFNTTGPSQDPTTGMVIPRFVRSALDGKPIEVHGNGQQVRCFSYVSDVVRWMVELIHSQAPWNNVYNVGSDKNLITIHQLALRVARQVADKIGGDDVPIQFDSDYWREGKDAKISIRSPDLMKTRKYVPDVGDGMDLYDIIEEVITFQMLEEPWTVSELVS